MPVTKHRLSDILIRGSAEMCIKSEAVTRQLAVNVALSYNNTISHIYTVWSTQWSTKL